MEYIIHVGLPKTGSTSLQKALWDNRVYLRQHGVAYPGTLSEVRPKHKDLMKALDSAPKQARIKDWEKIIFEESAGAEICVLSNEEFAFMAKPEMFTSLIPRNRMRVVMYVREPVEYFASRYRHNMLSRNLAMSFKEFAKYYRLPYLSVAERWGDLLGRERVEIRRNTFSDGKWDIVFDFFNNVLRLQIENSNPALDYILKPGIAGNLLFIKRVLNLYITREEANLLRREFRDSVHLDSSFLGKIPVDQMTVDLIATRTQGDLDALNRHFRLLIKPRVKPVIGHPCPDLGKLGRDFAKILAAARERNSKLTPYLERMAGMFAQNVL